MRSSLACLAVPITVAIALLGSGCDSESEPAGSGGQAAQGGSGGSTGSTGASDTGGEGGVPGAGGSGGTPECLTCAQAMTRIQSGATQGKICEDPTSTSLFAALAQCYCGPRVCGDTDGACATVCDPEPDPDVSQECFSCIVDSFSGDCEAQAQACSADT